MEIISLLLAAQRWATGLLGTGTLVAGSLAWGPVAGLWVSMLVIGMLSLVAGAILHEIDLRHKANHLVTGLLTDREANAVKLSGLAYLAICLIVGWFGATVVGIVCALMLIDFVAGHPLARSIDALA